MFAWDPAKAALNRRKHGVSFDVARLVFFDPDVLIDQDTIEGGEYRWRAIGKAGGQVLLFVAHITWLEDDGVEVVRIISARLADKAERRLYEQHIGQG